MPRSRSAVSRPSFSGRSARSASMFMRSRTAVSRLRSAAARRVRCSSSSDCTCCTFISDMKPSAFSLRCSATERSAISTRSRSNEISLWICSSSARRAATRLASARSCCASRRCCWLRSSAMLARRSLSRCVICACVGPRRALCSSSESVNKRSPLCTWAPSLTARFPTMPGRGACKRTTPSCGRSQPLTRAVRVNSPKQSSATIAAAAVTPASVNHRNEARGASITVPSHCVCRASITSERNRRNSAPAGRASARAATAGTQRSSWPSATFESSRRICLICHSLTYLVMSRWLISRFTLSWVVVRARP